MSGTYKTVQGDMWDTIAFKKLGSVNYTGALLAANRAHADTYIFPAGVVLTLPELPTVTSDDLPPWKRAVG